MTEQRPVCTCEDVLAQSRWASIFAIVEMLRGAGALEVLHGQTVTQDILFQVRTGPELSCEDKQKHVYKKWCWVISRELHLVCKITQHREQSKASVVSICRSDSIWGVFCFLFCNNVIVMLIWNSNSANENTLSVRGNQREDHTLLFESFVGLGQCGKWSWYQLRANVRLLLFLYLPTEMGAT